MAKTWEELKREHHTGTLADDLVDYSGYVCDAISELADSSVSIYTADQKQFALENSEITAQAVNEFGLETGDDFEEYVARAGAMGWYYQNEMEIYENLEEGITLCVIEELRKARQNEELNENAWQYVIDRKNYDWDDNNARIDDITEEAVTLYAEYIAAAWACPDCSNESEGYITVLETGADAWHCPSCGCTTKSPEDDACLLIPDISEYQYMIEDSRGLPQCGAHVIRFEDFNAMQRYIENDPEMSQRIADGYALIRKND